MKILGGTSCQIERQRLLYQIDEARNSSSIETKTAQVENSRS